MGPIEDGQKQVERSQEIAALLRERRSELLIQYDHCAAELHPSADTSPDDEDATERACSSAAELLEHLESEIRGIDEALERLREGRYGYCTDCGGPIPLKRLRAIPTARRCLDCQANAERKAG